MILNLLRENINKYRNFIPFIAYIGCSIVLSTYFIKKCVDEVGYDEAHNMVIPLLCFSLFVTLFIPVILIELMKKSSQK